MTEEIIIIVDAKGNPKVEVSCGNGSSCAQLTKGIEAALGETVADEKKPEFFQTAKATNHVKR